MAAQRPKAGQVWFHQGKTDEPYRIIEVIDNATGYESSGKIADPIVVYVQEYDGQVARKGKRWARDLQDFFKNFVMGKEG